MLTEEMNNNSVDVEIIPDAHQISTAAVVNLLIKKGICTADELFTIEKKINGQHRLHELNYEQRPRNSSSNGNDDSKASFINIKNPYDRGRFSGLKRAMSKHRWSRRLGTMLFGWKWKKIKKNPLSY